MTGLVRKATLLSVCGLLIASAAVAGVPSGATSSLPPGNTVYLGVFSTAPPGPGGRVLAGDPANFFLFTITVRDLASNVVAGTTCTVDFTGCTDLYVSQNQMAGLTTDCLSHTVTAVTNLVGQANFKIVGASNNPSGGNLPASPAVSPNCAQVRAGGTGPAYLNGVVLGNLGVITPDMDNAVAVGAADLGSEIGDVLYSQANLPQYFRRADMEADGDNDAADIGKLIDIFLNVLVAGGVNGGSCGDPGGVCCSLLP